MNIVHSNAHHTLLEVLPHSGFLVQCMDQLLCKPGGEPEPTSMLSPWTNPRDFLPVGLHVAGAGSLGTSESYDITEELPSHVSHLTCPTCCFLNYLEAHERNVDHDTELLFATCVCVCVCVRCTDIVVCQLTSFCVSREV